jgi:exopolysaccharide biosynthesis polyprenyl glycosylphosphotransferase
MECSSMTTGQLKPMVGRSPRLSTRRQRWDSQRAWIPDQVRDRIAGKRSRTAARRAAQTRRLFFSDALIISCALLAGQFLRFEAVPLTIDDVETNYTLHSVVLAVLWMGFLAAGIRSTRFTRRGLDEYAVLTAVTMQLFGAVAILALLMHIDLSRGYLAIALPLGLGGLIVNHWSWRQVTARRHRRGLDQTPILVVGGDLAAGEVAAEFDKDPYAEYHVVGVCTPSGPTDGDRYITVNDRHVPIVGRDQMVIDAVSRTGVHAVALAATDRLRPVEIRRLMWDLEALGVDLMVAPGLVDVADQRLRSNPVAGMAVFEVAKPQYSRSNSMLKRGLDIAFAAFAVLMTAPMLIVAAIAVKLTSSGPIFYLSERIGLDGTPFRMIKFRSMYDGAEAKAVALIAADGGNAMFFKMKDDPRVTPVGQFMRKYSLDELPQFFNVLRGEMSVVGPRPQVRREVDTYDDLIRRRLTVKPGLTGLWQVSGRSDLDVKDAIRLDLSYVENWSLLGDVMIIAKTVLTVLRGEGAY